MIGLRGRLIRMVGSGNKTPSRRLKRPCGLSDALTSASNRMSTVYGHPVQQRLRRCGVVSGDATPSPSYRIRTLNPDTLATGGGAWYDFGNTATVQRRLDLAEPGWGLD